MDTRETIERKVEENPGISFTELKEITGVSNGVLQYHLNQSEEIERKNQAVLKKGACKGCGLKDKCRDKCLRKVLRNQRNQRIIRMMIEDATYSSISEELGIDPSTVSYHVSKLEELGVLDENGVSSKVKSYLDV